MVGLTGYPNVGKSSTINALFGAKKTAVAATPGKTKHFQTLNVTPALTLCDCPGLVLPTYAASKADLVAAGRQHAVCLPLHSLMMRGAIICRVGCQAACCRRVMHNLNLTAVHIRCPGFAVTRRVAVNLLQQSAEAHFAPDLPRAQLLTPGIDLTLQLIGSPQSKGPY